MKPFQMEAKKLERNKPKLSYYVNLYVMKKLQEYYKKLQAEGKEFAKIFESIKEIVAELKQKKQSLTSQGIEIEKINDGKEIKQFVYQIFAGMVKKYKNGTATK